MKQTLLTLLTILFFFTVASCEETREKQEISKTLYYSLGLNEKRSLLIDNINGSITVTGYDSDAVQLIVHETIKGESQRRIDEAKKEVTIETKEDGDRIRIYVDGPWRRSDGSCNYRGYDYYGYEVVCDFELRVPRKLDVTAKTVNDGYIKLINVEGMFNASNVNGNIKLKDMDGSGKAVTVNGNVEASFKKNPTDESAFKTVNGEVNIKFQSDLRANLEFKTMNGEVYSDFEMKSLPMKSTSVKHRNGMKIYKSGDSFSASVGNGGPDITFDTLNGDIYVSKIENK